jgi:hypothetical protein
LLDTYEDERKNLIEIEKISQLSGRKKDQIHVERQFVLITVYQYNWIILSYSVLLSPTKLARGYIMTEVVSVVPEMFDPGEAFLFKFGTVPGINQISALTASFKTTAPAPDI